jgi:hypothetical protein
MIETTMHASGSPHQGGRGTALLLQHLAALEQLGEERPTAIERLEDELGPDFAQMLVGALTGERGVRARRLRLVAALA